MIIVDGLLLPLSLIAGNLHFAELSWRKWFQYGILNGNGGIHALYLILEHSKLADEAAVRVHLLPALPPVSVRHLEGPLLLPHEVGADYRPRPRNTRCTMHQDAICRLVFWEVLISRVQCIVDEIYSLLKILFDVFFRHIINGDYQVLKLSWIFWLYAPAHSDNMSDFILFKKW